MVHACSAQEVPAPHCSLPMPPAAAAAARCRRSCRRCSHIAGHLTPPPQTSLTKEVSLPGMMTAITEVEVSKEDKMRKIEETEAIKHAMLLKQTGRCAGWCGWVPPCTVHTGFQQQWPEQLLVRKACLHPSTASTCTPVP